MMLDRPGSALFDSRCECQASPTAMNPEIDAQLECEPKKCAEPKKRTPRGPRLQRRLHESISESRMLQVLDQSLDSGLNNQELEDELVCDSTMVAVETSTAAEEPQQRVAGVLKTVRHINRERLSISAPPPPRRENQAEDAK